MKSFSILQNCRRSEADVLSSIKVTTVSLACINRVGGVEAYIPG
jgi:hypothetical protein